MACKINRPWFKRSCLKISFNFKYTIYKTFSTSSQHFQSGSNPYSKILRYHPGTFIIYLRRASGTVDLRLTLSRYGVGTVS